MSKRRLTPRQAERVKSSQAKRLARVGAPAADSIDELSPEHTGTVIANLGVQYDVRTATDTIVTCKTRQNLGDIVCGDDVVWRTTPDGGVVVAVAPRRALLARLDSYGRSKAVAANIDLMAIVIAPAPSLSESLLDSYVVAAELCDIPPVIVVNKSDLFTAADRAALESRMEIYSAIGYPILYTDAKHHQGIDSLRALWRDHTGVVVGYSGVGKSSLLRCLLPDVQIAVGELSTATGLGKHTTTVTRLYALPKGGSIIDSPGVRDFKLGAISAPQLAQGFREFRPHLGHCKFNDCMHTVEPGCAVRAAAQQGHIDPRRIASYERILKTVSQHE